MNFVFLLLYAVLILTPYLIKLVVKYSTTWIKNAVNGIHKCTVYVKSIIIISIIQRALVTIRFICSLLTFVSYIHLQHVLEFEQFPLLYKLPYVLQW